MLKTSDVWPESVTDSTHAHDLIVRALYAGLQNTSVEDTELASPQEKIMAMALHYGDELAPYKNVLKQAYELILCAPQHWPASHGWIMAGKWLKATGLESDFLRDSWRKTVILGMAHTIATAWFDCKTDDAWLHTVDSTITKAWPLMENAII